MHYLPEILIVSFFVIIIICALMRDYQCWYWKINKHIELQEKILIQLQNLELKICDIKFDIKNDLANK